MLWIILAVSEVCLGMSFIIDSGEFWQEHSAMLPTGCDLVVTLHHTQRSDARMKKGDVFCGRPHSPKYEITL
jgi:hypothetical protein